MRLTLWLLGHEVLSLELGSDTGPADEYAVLTGGVEVGPGDDGTRYAPGFSEDDCFEPEDRPFRAGFAGGL